MTTALLLVALGAGALLLLSGTGALRGLAPQGGTVSRRTLTPEEAENIIARWAPSKATRIQERWMESIRAKLQNRLLNPPPGEQCTGTGGVDVGGIVSQGASATAAFLPVSIAVPVLAPIGIFASLFGAHKVAVQNERAVLCAAVPAANRALLTIKENIRTGEFSRADAFVAYKDLFDSFSSAIAPIIKDSASQCNAACWHRRDLGAIIEAEQWEISTGKEQ